MHSALLHSTALRAAEPGGKAKPGQALPARFTTPGEQPASAPCWLPRRRWRAASASRWRAPSPLSSAPAENCRWAIAHRMARHHGGSASRLSRVHWPTRWRRRRERAGDARPAERSKWIGMCRRNFEIIASVPPIRSVIDQKLRAALTSQPVTPGPAMAEARTVAPCTPRITSGAMICSPPPSSAYALNPSRLGLVSGSHVPLA